MNLFWFPCVNDQRPRFSQVFFSLGVLQHEASLLLPLLEIAFPGDVMWQARVMVSAH